MTVRSAISGNNADLIQSAATLYIKDGDTVADVTYGKGAFWKKTNLTRFTLFGSDLLAELSPAVEHGMHLFKADFTNLPYPDHILQVIVLDPPYVHNPGNHLTDTRYNNAATTKGMYHNDIMRDLYFKGMEEAVRVLKPSESQLWVKCKDEVESSVQRWSHIEIYEKAIELGFFGRDLFVLTPTSQTSDGRWTTQTHARKNHSYLWVFELASSSYSRQVKRARLHKEGTT